MNEEIKGDSGREYESRDISIEATYRLMMNDTLWNRAGEQVFPVRHSSAPYFKKFRTDSAFSTPVDVPRPRSVLHTKCIEFMLRNITSSGVKLSTPIFHETKGRLKDGQVLLSIAKDHYHWWSDVSGTRIPVGYGRYIQPDLCGRLAQPVSFAASVGSPNVIVEVIDTHFPEEATFFELLRLSTQNYIVALHFVEAPNYGSYWSQLETPTGGQVVVRDVYFLVDGQVMLNGSLLDPTTPPTDRGVFSGWYSWLVQEVLKPVMRVKVGLSAF